MVEKKYVQDLVSIAIPAFKRKWLREAIESALAQDYDNIELIIVDDHSPQNLREIVSPYLTNKRVSYHYNKENVGKDSVANNWNRCLEYAKGEFFVLLRDDDILMPNFVSTLLALARKYPQCDIFHGRRMIYQEKTHTEEASDSWPEYELFDDFVKAKTLVKRKHTITEFMYRSQRIKKEQYTVFPVGYFSDDASILRMVKNGGIASSCEPICKIRISEGQISSAGKYSVKKLKAALMYYDWYKANIEPQAPRERFKNEIDDWAYRFYSESNLTNKIRILSIVPYYVWPMKQKTVLFMKALFGECQNNK